MMEFLGCLAMFAVFALLPLPLLRWTRLSFAVALPAALGAALLLTVAAAAWLRSIPQALALVGGLLGLLLALSLLLCKERAALLRAVYQNPNFAAFTLVFAVVCVLYSFGRFVWWDEWSHWGLMVKAMVLADPLYTDPTIWLPVHKDYPVSLTLLSAVWCRFSGGYSEAAALRSLYVFCAALVLPLFPVKRLRQSWKPLAGVALCFLCVTGADNAGFPFTYYMDAPAGLVFGLCCWLALRMDFSARRKGESLALLFLLAFLPWMKEIGVLLALAAAGIYLCCFLRALRMREHGLLRHIPALAAAFALPVVMFLLWRGYCKHLGIPGQFQLEIAPAREILAAFFGRGSAFQRETLAQFWKGFFFVAQRYVYPLWALLAALMLAGSFFARRDASAKPDFLRRFRLAAPVYMLGYFGFALALLYLYLFGGFSVPEANRLASMDRYLGCYATAMMFVFTGIYAQFRASFAGKPPKTPRAVAALLTASFLLRPSPAFAAPFAGLQKSTAAKPVAIAVQSYGDRLDPAADKVYLVQDQDSQRLFQYAYYLYPVQSSPAGQSKHKPAKITADGIRERWAKGGYTHLIITAFSASFGDHYPELFDCPPAQIADGVLYEIIEQRGVLCLRPLVIPKPAGSS
ncbi:MAG: hypothetical protein LBC83_01650 [Oscillospiraceae bacterium]|jgi:hypothetical protein|nr:hypothetical protein [Oscillospiraceae bacterium]